MQRIRLIKKFASTLNGVELTKFKEGDVLYMSEAAAAMLIREGWAELVTDEPPRKTGGAATD